MIQIFTDARCLDHQVPRGFPERPERLGAILEELRHRGFQISDLGSHPASHETVRRLHESSYLDRFRRAVERGDALLDSADNPLSAGTWDAAWGAVDAALHAADWVVGDSGRRAMVAVRPPGHHAEKATAMGFCFFNNVAVAAEYLLRTAGIERVAIVDFDVHHGNGTQHLFEERAEVLYASLHQYPFYPGTGRSTERGWGAGEGTTVNVPLPAGTDDRGYERAFLETLLPALDAYRPEVVLVSAGFDVWRGDPVGGMDVDREAFANWGRWLAEAAERHGRGRVLSLLEGGYAGAEALPSLVMSYLEGLAGPSRRPMPDGDKTG